MTGRFLVCLQIRDIMQYYIYCPVQVTREQWTLVAVVCQSTVSVDVFAFHIDIATYDIFQILYPTETLI